MDFADIRYFVLLAVPAVLIGLYVAYWRWKRRTMARVGDEALLEAMSHSRSARGDVASFTLVALSLTFLVGALAGPQWGEKHEEVRRRGIDVVFAVDISRSMLAEDVPPSRLAAARAEINRILSQLDGDRVGLVGFAGIAFSQCPLTTDYSAVRIFLDLLDPEAMPVQGTAIGRAVQESVHLLTRRRGMGGALRPDEPDTQSGRDQLVVLFTDGEDHETRPSDAAAAALEQGIRVFTVPVGTDEGARIPIFDRQGRRIRWLTDRTGNEVQSRVDAEALEGVASSGGGIVIPYEGEGSVASVLEREIDRLQAAEIEEILRPEQEERFYFFVAPALALLLIAMALNDRKRGAPHVGWLSALLLSLALPGLGGCEDLFVYESDEVEEGLAQSGNGDTAAGLDQIRGFRAEIAPEDLIDERALDYNEAVALLRDGQSDEATRLFTRAIGSQDIEVQFRSHYNIGNLAFGEEDYREALDRYRRALDLRPEDEDAKWNLEVTLRRLYPPCMTFEDAFEQNDRPEEASPLELATDTPIPPVDDAEDNVPARVLCGADADWYRIDDVLEGALVSVSVTFERLREDTGGAELPDTIPADGVWIALYEGDGGTVLGTDAGQASNEAGEPDVDARQLTRELQYVPVPPGAVPTGTLFLEIDANLGLEYEYDVEVSVWPPCSAAEDAFEDNDVLAQAAALEPGDHPLVICPDDADWFRFPVELGDSVFVDIQPGPDQGLPAVLAADEQDGDEHTVGLRAELYRAGETEPIDANWGRDGMLELVALDLAEPGELVLKVESMQPGMQGPYSLSLFRFAPCIVGDDDLEQNDLPQAAAQVDPTQGPKRHLRICDGDDDWFRVTLTEGEHFSAAIEWAEPERSLAFAMTAPGSDQVIAYGTPAEAPEPPEREPDALTPPPPRARYQRSVHIEEPEQSGPYNLRVAGDPGFYNLVFPDPNQDQSCDNPQEGESESESDDQQDDSTQDDSEQQDDRQQQDDASESDQQAGDEQQEPQPQDPQEGQSESEVDSDSELAEQEMSEEEAARERLRQLLESLAGEQDRNLQLERALENIEPIQVERQW